MRLKFLEWDSDFFNLKIGQIEVSSLDQEILSEILNIKNKEGFDFVYLFADKLSGDTVVNNTLLADKKVVFKKEFTSIIDEKLLVTTFKGDVTPELLNLAIISGQESRFKKDIILRSKFEDLYAEWIEKSVSGELADKVFVTYNNEEISGFVTVKIKESIAVIGLMAINPMYHGQGIGSVLIDKVNNWCLENNIIECEVSTQLDNINACKFYQKNHFEIKLIKYIYHI